MRLACVFSLLMIVSVGADESLPRYAFHAGQVLTYDSSSGMKYENGEHKSSASTSFHIVKQNDDGSFRILAIQKSSFTSGDSPAQEDVDVAIVDISPMGDVKSSDAVARVQFASYFPRLPADAATRDAGWTSTAAFDTTHRYTAGKSAPGEFVFEDVSSSPEDAIYLSTHRNTFHFDLAKGFIGKSETAYSQGYGFVGKGTGESHLKSLEMREPAAVGQLAADLASYEEASTNYAALERTAEKDVKKHDEALAALKNAKIQNEELRQAMNKKISQHEQSLKYSIEDTQRKARLRGHAMPDFSLEDIDGKKVALADLRGKVVVLDFWYRGCGWCVRAMPQINQLADDFKDKPVVILGMNTDSNIDDAKFVIEKMGLKYNTLRSNFEFATQCGVQGFPTLILIDPAGNIADFHVGYAKDLREKVGREIEALLPSK